MKGPCSSVAVSRLPLKVKLSLALVASPQHSYPLTPGPYSLPHACPATWMKKPGSCSFPRLPLSEVTSAARMLRVFPGLAGRVECQITGFSTTLYEDSGSMCTFPCKTQCPGTFYDMAKLPCVLISCYCAEEQGPLCLSLWRTVCTNSWKKTRLGLLTWHGDSPRSDIEGSGDWGVAQ